MELTFFVEGTPSPGGSKRAFTHKHTGKTVVIDMGGKKTKDWKKAVSDAAIKALAASKNSGWFFNKEPLYVVCTFFVERPKSHFGSKGLRANAPAYPISRPDATKLFRSTEDALTGIVWGDDSQVIAQAIYKFYGDTPGAKIHISKYEENN